jgi:tartrate dehydratase beta subunit/fumarate hydratase class I family protein
MSSIGFSYGYISSLRDQCKKKIEEKGEGTSKKEVAKNRVNPVNSSKPVDSDGKGSSTVSATPTESASK